MIIKPFYELCPKMEAFIKFYTSINKKIILPIIGYELYCCDPECDCRLTTIMMYNAKTEKCLATLQYAWDNYDHYIKEKFVKSDVDNFINGCLMMLENRNSTTLAILTSFQNWLAQDKENKKQLFINRYQQFKVAAKVKGFTSKQSNDCFLENIGSMLKLGVFDDLIADKIKNFK
jgi:hypothetical protein